MVQRVVSVAIAAVLLLAVSVIGTADGLGPLTIEEWLKYKLKTTIPGPAAVGAVPGSAGWTVSEPSDYDVEQLCRNVLARSDETTRRKPLRTMDDLDALVAEHSGALKPVQDVFDHVVMPKRLHDLFDAWIADKRNAANYAAAQHTAHSPPPAFSIAETGAQVRHRRVRRVVSAADAGAAPSAGASAFASDGAYDEDAAAAGRMATALEAELNTNARFRSQQPRAAFVRGQRVQQTAADAAEEGADIAAGERVLTITDSDDADAELAASNAPAAAAFGADGGHRFASVADAVAAELDARLYAELDSWMEPYYSGNTHRVTDPDASSSSSASSLLEARATSAAAPQPDPDAAYFTVSDTPSAHRGVQQKLVRCAVCQVWMNQTVFDTQRLAEEAVVAARGHRRALDNMLSQLVAGSNGFQQKLVRPYAYEAVPVTPEPPPIRNAPLQLVWSFPLCVNEGPVVVAEALAHAIKASYGMSVNCTRSRIDSVDERLPQSITTPLVLGD